MSEKIFINLWNVFYICVNEIYCVENMRRLSATCFQHRSEGKTGKSSNPGNILMFGAKCLILKHRQSMELWKYVYYENQGEFWTRIHNNKI